VWAALLCAGLLLCHPAAAKVKSKLKSSGGSKGGAGAGSNYYTKFNINRPLSVSQAMFGSLGFDAALGLDGKATAVIQALEVGCGEGRTILELQAAIPNSQVHCLNHPAYGATRGFAGANLGGSRKFLQPVMNRYHISIPNGRLPKVAMGDAFNGVWPYEDSTFEVIFSSHCFTKNQNIGQSMAEAQRVLKPGGEAFFHVGLESANQALRAHCDVFSKTEKTTLYCNNDGEGVAYYHVVYGLTARQFEGQQLDPDAYYGVISYKKDPSKKCADVDTGKEVALRQCMQDHGRILDTMRDWSEEAEGILARS